MEMGEHEKRVFFAEVFLANLELANNKKESPLLDKLRNPESLTERKQITHTKVIKEHISNCFPSKTTKEFAREALAVSSISNKLKIRVEKPLDIRKSGLKYEDFLKVDDSQEALLILPVLLSRPRNNPQSVLDDFCRYSNGEKDGPFPDWVHNNLFGAVLEAYRPYNLTCPLYSGFEAFFTMSNNNLRHFLILCYKAREFSLLVEQTADRIPPSIQARAAYDAADKLISEIKTFGPLGERLRMFVLRLGNIFRALQSMPSMSEPEQNHFTINSGRSLSDEEKAFLSEAKKYGILTEQLGNKVKGIVGGDIVDYQLNPIYSPYFKISYRRKRKKEISVEDFHTLSLGSEDDYNKFFTDATRVENQSSQADLWE
jgi:hypothetical protein